MIIIHHNKDMDGYTSGAICKRKYPEATLLGWDYKDEIPDFKEFYGEDVIMIDITFPLARLIELGRIARLTVIDHHISFRKDFGKIKEEEHTFEYYYEDGVAACEIGWKFCFPNEPVPYAITLIGRYDTWRQKEGDWEGETLPFKYYMYGNCNSAETFPTWVIEPEFEKYISYEAITTGKQIMTYQRTMDEAAARSFSFEKEVFGELRGLCMNQGFFSSETCRSIYNPDKHDIMIGFILIGNKWSVSLRSAKEEVDVSLIAKRKGGGGHKGAAGFEVKTFEEIWT
jgi:oligoribonuclease NrnB/cAMP/cGMP phosphodiesterase (DHH superfamily)